MVFCDHCLKDVPGERFEYDCCICCGGCGKVLEECSFSEEPHYVKNAARKVDDIYNEEEKSSKKIKLWEHDNHEYIKEQAVKEAELNYCSPEWVALCASVVEAVIKAKKEMRMKRAQEATSQMLKTKEVQENLEKSKDEMKEDELGSVDLGCDDYGEMLSNDEFTDSDMDGEYENTLYQENAYKTYGSEDDDYGDYDE